MKAAQSLLSHPSFFRCAVAIMVGGNAIDLIGTYISQPNFENEANAIFIILKRNGYTPGWPLVIFAKTMFSVVCSIGLYYFLKLRRSYYPPPEANFREFITTYFYGRPVTWLQTAYKIPRLKPTLLMLFGFAPFGGFYWAYLGVDNVSYEYGWPQLGGFFIGSFWVHYGLFVILFPLLGWFFWEMWRDFRSTSH